MEEKFRTGWNVPHMAGAVDRKHIAMKKPKQPGNDYYSYKGFFSLFLLGLVDAEYKLTVGQVVLVQMHKCSTEAI